MENAYRFLRGKMGANGHARSGEKGQQLSVRGLKNAMECAVYCWQMGDACCVARGKTDESGQARFSGLPAGPLFVTAEGEVILWEMDAPEENYFRACAVLQKEKIKADEKSAPISAAVEERTEATEIIAEAAETEEEIAIPEETAAEAYTLRPPGDAPGVDELPEIIFPGKSAAWKKYFRSCPPIMPFSAPGWRFVRAPSPLPGVAYCALGYLARNGRAEKIAYAIPGTPHHPPAQLSGYRYHGGYWVLVQQTEE